MKLSNKYLLILGTFLFFSSGIFSQTKSLSPELKEIYDAFLVEIENHRNQNGLVQSRDEDDLLLATRTDNYLNSAWESVDSVEYYYDDENREIERVGKMFDGSEWVNWYRILIGYDADNYALLAMESWDGMAWWRHNQTTYEYDMNDNETASYHQSWDTLLGLVDDYRRLSEYNSNNENIKNVWQNWEMTEWVNNSYDTTEYDSNGNRSLRFSKNWIGTEWRNFRKNTYEYDGFGNWTLWLRQRWNETDWENDSQNLWTFDSNGNRIESEYQRWVANAWNNVNKSIYQYDPNNNWTLWSRQIWMDDEWKSSSRDSFEYDANHNQIKSIHQVLLDTVWESTRQTSHEYNEDDNRVFSLIETWSGTAWLPTSRTYYYYLIITDVTEQDFSERSFQIYPNPGNGHFTLNIENPDLQNLTLEVYNTSGQLMHQQNIASEAGLRNLDLTRLGNGTYYIHFKDGNRHFTKTVQIIK